MNSKFIITNTAYIHLRNLVQDNQAIGIALGLKNSGCSGLAYIINLVQTVQESHNTQQITFGDLDVFVDPQHLNAFNRMKIDYVQDGLNSRLVFDNPNTYNECGCGSSFKVRDAEEE